MVGMVCRAWKLIAVGLALLCGACVGPSGAVQVVPSPTAVPVPPTAMPSAMPLVAATPAPAVSPTTSAGQSCSLTEPSSSPSCDKEILLASRDVLRGTHKEGLPTWQRHNPIELFEGVRVDGSSGRVVAIDIDYWVGQDLTGSIPPTLGQLGQLERLDLGAIDLTGPIPPELGQLGHLRTLDLSHNRLTGAIPPALGQLGQLEWLYLNNNDLTGPIPPVLGQLGRLRTLNLSVNELTGAIPPVLGQLGRLHTLNLNGNELTGAIPSALGQLGQLERLYLGGNELTGAIPPTLGQLGHLQGLDLSHNRLTGAIPSALGQLGQLERLYLGGNELTGAIPPALGQLGHLITLDLSHNRLTGAIPPALGQLGHLETLELTGNLLTGVIPPALKSPAPFGTLLVAGAYTNQAEHWEGHYHVLRQGRQVTVTLNTRRSPVWHGAREHLQPLVRLPDGFQPVLPVTWTVTARSVTAQGQPRPTAPAVTVILEVRSDGTVYHVDAPTLDGAGYVEYHTTITWITDELDSAHG